MRVVGGTVDEVHRVVERAQLGDVRLAEQDRARGAQILDHDSVLARDVSLENARGVAARQSGDLDRFLDGERHSVERAELVTGRYGPLGRPRLLPSLLEPRHDERVQRRVERLDPVHVGVEHLDGAHLSAPDRLRDPGRR